MLQVGMAATTSDGHTVSSDLPRSVGGNNAATQPVYLLLAALAGCKQATAMFVARHMKPPLDISSISFELEAVRNERGALSLPLAKPLPAVSHLQRIHGTARAMLRMLRRVKVAEEGSKLESLAKIESGAPPNAAGREVRSRASWS